MLPTDYKPHSRCKSSASLAHCPLLPQPQTLLPLAHVHLNQYPCLSISLHPRYEPQTRVQSPFGLQLNPQGDNPTGPVPSCWAVCGQADEESFDAEGAPVSCPWFYPVVEQHDVTYHRVKPLAGHRETDTHRAGATPEAHQAEPGEEVTTVTTGKTATNPPEPTQRAKPPTNRGPAAS